MYWFRKQFIFWRYYGNTHPYKMFGLISFVLVGGIVWGSFAGHYLRAMIYPPAPSAVPSPVFSPSPSIKPMRKPVRTHPAPPRPTYRPEPRPTTPRPTRTSHSPSPTPTKTEHHGPCWPLVKCPPPPADSPSPTPDPGSGNDNLSQGSL